MLRCFIIVVTFSQVISVPLEPGEPGGPWTEEEIDIVYDVIDPLPIKKMKKKKSGRGLRLKS